MGRRCGWFWPGAPPEPLAFTLQSTGLVLRSSFKLGKPSPSSGNFVPVVEVSLACCCQLPTRHTTFSDCVVLLPPLPPSPPRFCGSVPGK